MDSIAITALILSIIAILLWVYTFLFHGKIENPFGNIPGSTRTPAEKKDEPSLPVHSDSTMREGSVVETPETAESQFMNDTLKFSQMVQKNLEILNTRVGVKFNLKPLSGEYSRKPKEPNFVDSMDVTDEKKDRMITDDSSE